MALSYYRVVPDERCQMFSRCSGVLVFHTWRSHAREPMRRHSPRLCGRRRARVASCSVEYVQLCISALVSAGCTSSDVADFCAAAAPAGDAWTCGQCQLSTTQPPTIQRIETLPSSSYRMLGGARLWRPEIGLPETHRLCDGRGSVVPRRAAERINQCKNEYTRRDHHRLPRFRPLSLADRRTHTPDVAAACT